MCLISQYCVQGIPILSPLLFMPSLYSFEDFFYGNVTFREYGKQLLCQCLGHMCQLRTREFYFVWIRESPPARAVLLSLQLQS